ncbi:hypothetical protein R1flu_014173 [Riccia fluitans]|uniref:SGNH hydrolase-type esterase domain-containing protein n=1 Tax=Riccia fluitans TaxID=41844 RepID=A0ABD1YIH0_9MARC
MRSKVFVDEMNGRDVNSTAGNTGAAPESKLPLCNALSSVLDRAEDRGISRPTSQSRGQRAYLKPVQSSFPYVFEMAGHQRPLFVLFGASMTQYSFELGGWGAALADLYQRQADVLLRGFSGWNTRRALEVIQEMFPKDIPRQPSLVVVFFGANDAAFPLKSGRGQHVPIEEFKENLKKIATYLTGLSDTTRVILTTAPPIHDETRDLIGRMNYGEKAAGILDRTNENARKYAAACKEAAAEAGVGVVDLWTSIQQTSRNWGTECLTDGMHLSAEGSRVMLTELCRVIEKADWVPSLRPESMPIDYVGPHRYDWVHPVEEM